MVNKISIYSIQISFLILKATSNLLQPEYSVKILNTENIVLSLGDPDDDSNDDLEIIKSFPGDTQLDRKLNKFHKYVKLIEMTERPREKYYFGPYNELRNIVPLSQMSYPDSPYEIAVDEKHLSMLERRRKKKKHHRKKWWRRKWFKNLKNSKKNQVEMKIKRQLSPSTPVPFFVDIEDAEMAYDDMEKEYWDYVAQSKKNNSAFKYSDEGKPEESVKDVVNKIIDVKTPKNCTNVTGIGLQAVECIVKNFRTGQVDRKHMFYSISIVLLVWFCIYLAIALPLWCSKGWCCCCCRCEFCFPTKTINEVQKYIAQNPPGIYINPSGVEEQYKPTQKETELYERLKRLIAEF